MLGALLVAGAFGAGSAQAVAPSLELFAGNGTTNTPAEGAALSVPLRYPRSVATDASGNVFVLTGVNNDYRIFKIDSSGQATYFVGDGTGAQPIPGPAASSPLWNPQQIATNAGGDLFIADVAIGQILKVTAAGTLSVIRSNVASYAVTVAPNGDIYYANNNSGIVYKQTPAGVETSVATFQSFNSGIYGLAVAANGTIYASSSSQNKILKFVSGTMTTVTTAVQYPQQLVLSGDGSLLVASASGQKVQKIDTPDADTPVVTTIAGTGTYGNGSSPAGDPLTTNLSSPNGVAVDATGAIYIAVTQANYVSRLSPTAPEAPVLTATPANNSASLSFTIPASNGSNIDHYEYSIDGGTWTTFSTAGTGPLTATITTGLTNGTPADIQVRAVNGIGNGAASNTITLTPGPTAPDAPVLTATPGNGSAGLSFTIPTDNGSAIDHYQYSLDSGTWTTFATAPAGNGPLTATITGLTNGTSSGIRVRAVNGASTPDGAASNTVSVTPGVVPSTPVLTVTPGDTSAVLSFPVPSSTNGHPITSYSFSQDNGANFTTFSPTGSPLTATISSLTNGTTYTFIVRATNDLGDSLDSTAVPVIPATVPDAPASLSVASGNASAALTYTVSPDPLSAPVTGYEYSKDAGVNWVALTGSGVLTGTATVSGLTNGTLSSIAVRAVNRIGVSTATTYQDVTPATTADAPTALSATVADQQTVLTFTAPASDGGSAITGYQVSTDDGTNWATLATTGSAPLNGTVTNLANGTGYQIKVRALNGVSGYGTPSSAYSVTPSTVPSAPTDLTATAGNNSATLSFTPVSDGGRAITAFEVQIGVATPVTLTTTYNSTTNIRSGTITGLTNGQAYSIALRVLNGNGNGAFTSPVSVTPGSVPALPTQLAATRGAGSASLTFTAPADPVGAAVTSYDYTIDGGTNWLTLTGASVVSGAGTATVTGLQNGTPYVIAVRAVNRIGAGPTSAAASSITPATVPGLPTNVVATAGNGSAGLSYTAPGSTGGAAITGYDYTVDAGTNWTSLTGSGVLTGTATVNGLTNGTSYVFAVRAVNSVNPGLSSLPATSVMPVGSPGVPGSVSLTPGNASASVSFTVPADGGSSITGYLVSTNGGTSYVTLSGSTSGSTFTGSVTGLTNGTTYQVRVQAVNVIGPSTGSAIQSVTPVAPVVIAPAPVVPGAPSTPSATAGIGSATVSWTAGSPSEGTTGYTVTASPGGAACSTTATSCVIAGTPGTAYTFTVTAHSVPGDSPASGPSTAVTPLAPVIPPTAPLDAPATLTTPDGQPTELEPSDDVTVTGTGFAANTAADVYAYSAPIKLGTATTTSTGTLSLDVTIPSTLEPGEHNLVATGVAPDGTQRTIRMPFTLVPAAVTGPASGPANVTVTASASRTFTVTFTKVTPVSGKLLGYEFSTSSGRHWKLLPTTGKTTRTVKITRLANGRLYEVAVRAITSAGPGETSTVIRAKAKRP